jgi:hypothetical protein
MFLSLYNTNHLGTLLTTVQAAKSDHFEPDQK